MKTIILASASPRRKEILALTGLKFRVEKRDFHEDMDLNMSPRKLSQHVSREKAMTVVDTYDNALVIAADTFIVFREKILGKPHTKEEARRMLKMLNGKVHKVITGFTIIDTDDRKLVSQSVETKVYLKRITMKEIESYVQTKEPLDKAGAYAIQGLGAVLVEKIEGDYFNVVGLPLSAVTESLKCFEIYVL
ncbi:MAG: Maf family protein [Candidatus Brocadiaceae bacterium]|nr:Maf family protein [Candidatus Brocadiaceae bacterium]